MHKMRQEMKKQSRKKKRKEEEQEIFGPKVIKAGK